MTVDFVDYFWGEKNNGFDVLYHNMKHGVVASKELADFFRERSAIEDNNYKLFSKLAKQVSSSNSVQGTFTPVWVSLKAVLEKLAGLHLQMAQKVSELIKDVSKYSDELHKKHKTVKEEEASTIEIVQSIQNVTVTLQKARDICFQRGFELEKLRKDNASQRELEKAEVKFKKAQDDYKTFVEKYSIIRNDFESKISQACRRFQVIEEMHLKQMKEFLAIYMDVLQTNHEEVGQVHADFKNHCLDLTVEELLQQFVQSKCTGFEKPGLIEYEEVMTSLAEIMSQSSEDVKNSEPLKEVSKGTNAETGVAGFLRSRREKRKEKKAKKKKESIDVTSNKDEKSDLDDKEEGRKSETPTPEVDEDGFCIKPKADSWDSERCFYSSSDSDSDDERDKKIHVEIKPLSNGNTPISASVDELRATVESLSLMSTNTVRRDLHSDSDYHMKRSQSVLQQLSGTPSSDLLGLNLSNLSGIPSSASTPIASHPYAPLQSPPLLTSPLVPQLDSQAITSKFQDGDLFSEVGNIAVDLPQKQSSSSSSSTPTGTINIPRPPSRRGECQSNRGRISPATISRADSIASLEFRASGVGMGTSRGPSPLTIGLADTIPLAVAFHEIVHSYFKGPNETLCQVRLSGDMMLSFPAGILTVLTNNPSPAKLIFRIKNSDRLEKVLPNSQLINKDVTQASVESMLFEFNMSALTTLLRKQAEQNPTASYFNVDILKYQVKAREGATSCPFHVVSYWKCEPNHTDLKIDYKYNSRAMASPSPLLNLQVAIPIEGGFKSYQSKPNAQWVSGTNRLLWKFTELSQYSEGNGVGSLKARVDLENGPGSQGTIHIQFNCEGTTLSGVDFELVGPGYRLSLVKRRFVSGKYICDGDIDPRARISEASLRHD
ncbi:F-BAR domain only protein 2 isoform X1 [Leptopilina boulardi]|uniref:F-BAR domain only protein 2 isoform X1 n=1 Tax=Leptopilina boulardi TaxID=63433 RepID=UPI0021F5573E|nr:F-BAR domain only protein 2 isoform X1 [Leptopilina boulardi]